MNILIVEDHRLVALPLQERLTREFHCVEIAETLAMARLILSAKNFDICFIDINLPDGLGTDLLQELTAEQRMRSIFLILSGTTDPDEIMIAMDHGAHGFVPKSVSFEALLDTINQITHFAQGSKIPVIWQEIDHTFVPIRTVFPPGTVLSPREREVFQLLRKGLQDKQIAFQTGRSIHTIRIQIRSVLRKRNKSRRGEALR